MRVLMVSKACIRGSYQKKLEELAKFGDIDLTVIVPPFWKEKARRIDLERTHTTGYTLIVENMALNGHFHLHFYPNLGTHVRRSRPDIMHIDEEPYNLATFLAIRLALRADAKPLFFTWQNLQRRYPFPFNWMEGHNYRHSAHAIAGNRDGVDVLRGKGYQGPVTVIPQFGVDTETYGPSANEPIKRHPQFRMGYVGRLVEEKGIDLLLRATAELEGEWRLSILGSGPYESRLKALSDGLGLVDRVAFQAPIPSAEMPAHYRQLDALILPSRTRSNWKEQFGRVLIEAMACGVPVVGSNSGEIPHVIGEAGLIFPENDTETLTVHLSALMGNPGLRQALGQKGRELVLRHYTQKQVARATREVYLQMAAS